MTEYKIHSQLVPDVSDAFSVHPRSQQGNILSQPRVLLLHHHCRRELGSRDQLDGAPPQGPGPFVAFVLITTRIIEFGEELIWGTGQTYRGGVPSQGVCYGWDIKSAFPGGVPAHVVGDAALAIASAPPAGAGSSSSSKDLYPRLVRRGVEVQTITKGGVRMKGLFTKDHLPVCTLVGFFLGDWYSDATYQELLEEEKDEPRPRPYEKYVCRLSAPPWPRKRTYAAPPFEATWSSRDAPATSSG